MGVGYPPDALPGAPLGVRARTTCAHALEVHRGEALSVRATSWGAHSGVQTLRSVARSSLSHALLSALGEQLMVFAITLYAKGRVLPGPAFVAACHWC